MSSSDPEPDLPDDEETLRATLRELQAQVAAANADDDDDDIGDDDVGLDSLIDEPVVQADAEPAKDASEMDEGDIEEDDPATLALLQQLGAQLQAQADAEEAAEREAEEAAEALEEAMETSQEEPVRDVTNVAPEPPLPPAPDAPVDLDSGAFDSNMLAYAQQVLEHAEAVSRMGSRAPSPEPRAAPTQTPPTSAAPEATAAEELPMELDDGQDGGDTQHEELLRKLLADLQAQVAEEEAEDATSPSQDATEERSRDVPEGPAAKRRRLDSAASPRRSPIPPSIEAALASQAEAQARAASATAQKGPSPVPTARAISVSSSPAVSVSVVSPTVARAPAAPPNPRATSSPRPAAVPPRPTAAAAAVPTPRPPARRTPTRSPVTIAAAPTVPKPLKSVYRPMSAEERAAALAPLRQAPIDLDHYAPYSGRGPARTKFKIRSKPKSAAPFDKAKELARAQQIIESVTAPAVDSETVVSSLASILPPEDFDDDSSDDDGSSSSGSDGGGRSPAVNLTPGPGMYRAKRVRNRLTLSCTECHRRKQQCDRKEPCTRCVKRGIPGLCHMEKVPLPLFRRKRLDDAGKPSKHHAIALKLRAIESIVRTEAQRQKVRTRTAANQEVTPSAANGEQSSADKGQEAAASESPPVAEDGGSEPAGISSEEAPSQPQNASNGEVLPDSSVEASAEPEVTATAAPVAEHAASDDDMDIDPPEDPTPASDSELNAADAAHAHEKSKDAGSSFDGKIEPTDGEAELDTEKPEKARLETGEVQQEQERVTPHALGEDEAEDAEPAEDAVGEESGVDEEEANLQAALAALLAAQAEEDGKDGEAQQNGNDQPVSGSDSEQDEVDNSDSETASDTSSEPESVNEQRQEALNTIGDLAYTLMQTRGAADDAEEEADGGIAAIAEVSQTIQNVVKDMAPGPAKDAALALLEDVLAAAPPPLPQYAPAATLWKEVPSVPPTLYASANSAYLEDKERIKLNLSLVGFREDSGRIFVPPTTRRMERQLYVKNGFSHEPLPVRGYGPFLEGGLRFAYGIQGKAWKDRRIAAVQAISTIGALRIGGTFVSRFAAAAEQKVVYHPDPSRQEDLDVFCDVGFTIKPYRHLNRSVGGLDWEGMQADLSSAEMGAVVILHVGGNMPSGIDLAADQWKATVELVKSRQLLPFFIMECQGLGSGDAEKDADPVRLMAHDGLPVILAQSFASSMGLYAENPSILSIICHDVDEKARIESQLVAISRSIHSQPQPWAAKIAATILADPVVYRTWLNETKAMSDRLRTIREKLFDQLQNRLKVPGDWQYIRASRGMFCTLLLTKEQLDLLRDRERMHLYPGGHVSLGCLNAAKIERLALAVDHVVRKPDAIEPVKYVPRPPPVLVAPARPIPAAGPPAPARVAPSAPPAALRPTAAPAQTVPPVAARSPQTARPRPVQPTAQGRPIPPRPPHIQVTVRTLDASQRPAPKPAPTPGRPAAAAPTPLAPVAAPKSVPSRSPAPAPALARPPPLPPSAPRPASAAAISRPAPTPTPATARPPLPAQPKPTGPMPPRPPGGVAGRPPTGPLGGRPGALAARSPISIPSLPAGALARLAGPPVRPVDPPIPRAGPRPGFSMPGNRSVSQPLGRQMPLSYGGGSSGGAASGVVIPASSGSPAVMLPLPPPQSAMSHIKREDVTSSHSSTPTPTNASSSAEDMIMDEDEMLRQVQAELERALQQTMSEASRTIAAS